MTMTAQPRTFPTPYWPILLPALAALWLLIELLLQLARTPLSPVITGHAAGALVAVLVGATALVAPKGSRLHRLAGYTWVVLMLGVAVSSFWLRSIQWFPGGFGPIHLLSVWTIVGLIGAVVAARRGHIRTHRQGMIGIVWGLLGAGAFALLPGRLMGVIALQSLLG